VAALLVAAVGGVATAQTDSQLKTNKAGLYQDFLAKFAGNLGVSEDKVVAALDATKKQMLDQAVKDGRLTQEQADRIAARPAGNPGWFGHFRGKDHDKKDKFGERAFSLKNDMVAKALGITPEQLKSDLESGKKLQQIIADRGLTDEQFRQKMLEIKKEARPKRE
jgi:polyhydroxyalkanoate synthesis regulator phasin